MTQAVNVSSAGGLSAVMWLFTELKRRNVLRVGAAYAVASWLLIQIAETIFPLFGFGDAPARYAVVLFAIGFVPAMVLAWAFELTPEGLKRDEDVDRSVSIAPQTGRKLDRLIMVVLALALGYFGLDKFVLSPERQAEELASATETAHEQGRSKALEDLAATYAENSIAVLPFDDMSVDNDQEYMTDGIAEELLNLLAKIPALRVTARTSAFSFKGKDDTIPEIAKQLNVAYVLEGSVRTSGDQIRITAQLIESHSGTHVWSETYTRVLDDIFAVQDDIAAMVVTQLKISVLGEMPSAQQIDTEAYTLYLQARHLLGQGSPESINQAGELYHQVLAISPGYAPALIGLVHVTNIDMGGMAPPEAIAPLVTEALEHSPDYPPAIAFLGLGAIFSGDLASAAQHIERALALDAADPDVLTNASYLYQTLGRSAVRLNEYIVARDPVNAMQHLLLSDAYYMAGRLDESIASARTALTLNPAVMYAHFEIGYALMEKGEYRRALTELEQEPLELHRPIGLISIYHSLEEWESSDALLQELIDKFAHDAPYYIAWPLAYRGETDRAFEYLERAVEVQDPGLYGIVGNKGFVSLYDDARWLPFLERIGRSPAQLDSIEFDVVLPE